MSFGERGILRSNAELNPLWDKALKEGKHVQDLADEIEELASQEGVTTASNMEELTMKTKELKVLQPGPLLTVPNCNMALDLQALYGIAI